MELTNKQTNELIKVIKKIKFLNRFKLRKKSIIIHINCKKYIIKPHEFNKFLLKLQSLDGQQSIATYDLTLL